MSRDDEGNDEVGDFVDSQVDGMVTGYVLLVTFIDADSGEARFYGDTMEGQPATTTLGLGSTIAAVESERIARGFFEDDD